MFRASSAHLQEVTVVHKQHMVPSLCMKVLGGLLVHSLSFRRERQYHMLHVYNCIPMKMSTWGSKHVQENTILWINNNLCIKLVINVWLLFILRKNQTNALHILYHFIHTVTLLHVSTRKGPSSGNHGTFSEQGQQNPCSDVNNRVLFVTFLL